MIPRTDFAVWCNSSAPECAGDNQVTSRVTYSQAIESDDTFLSNFLNILINRTKLGNILKTRMLISIVSRDMLVYWCNMMECTCEIVAEGGRCNVMECTCEILAGGGQCNVMECTCEILAWGRCNMMVCTCGILARGVNLFKSNL